jgi:hypothetical protein
MTASTVGASSLDLKNQKWKKKGRKYTVWAPVIPQLKLLLNVMPAMFVLETQSFRAIRKHCHL